MATNTSIALAAALVRSVDVGVYAITGKAVAPAVAQGDTITLFTAPHDMRVHYASLKVTGSAGAGATMQLRKSGVTTAFLTGVTNAGQFSVARSDQLGGTDIAAGETVEILVAGAASSAIAIEFDLLTSHA